MKYLSRGAGYSLFLTPHEAVLSLSKPQEVGRIKRSGSDMSSNKPAGTVLRLGLVGANEQPEVKGLDKLPGKSNYLIGNDSKQWTTGVEHYAKVHANVYPGIDLAYYGNQRQLEYDFIVAPGADPQQTQLSVKGTDQGEITPQGDLVLHTPAGNVVQHKPVIYQEINGQKKPIEGGYILPPLSSGAGQGEGIQEAF